VDDARFLKKEALVKSKKSKREEGTSEGLVCMRKLPVNGSNNEKSIF
jgi:hypothetical protein